MTCKMISYDILELSMTFIMFTKITLVFVLLLSLLSPQVTAATPGESYMFGVLFNKSIIVIGYTSVVKKRFCYYFIS